MAKIYDKEKKRFITTEEVKAGTSKKEYTYLAIDKYLTDQLLNFARADGMSMTAETPQGERVRQTNAIKSYVEIAISEFIAARESLDDSEPEEEQEEEPVESPN